MLFKKRNLIPIILVVVSLLLFPFVCIAGSNNGAEVVVRVITSTGSLAKALPQYIEDFNELNKGRIRIEAEAESISSLLPKLMTQFITKIPTYDIIPVNSPWCGRLEKYLVPLDSMLENDGLSATDLFGEKAMESRTDKQGSITSLPISSAAHILFYRTDLFEAAGLEVPKTLAEYLDAARKLTKRSDSGEVEVYGMGGFRSLGIGDDAQTLAYFLHPSGGRVLNAEKNDADPSLKGAVTIEVLEFMNTVAKEGLCPNPLSWDQYTDRPAFAQGKLAMSIIYSPIASMIEDPEQSRVVGKVGYEVLKLECIGPEPSVAFASGWGFGIDNNSANKEAAWEFIKYVTTNYDVQKDMGMKGLNDPSLLGVLSDPEFTTKIKSSGPIQEIMTDFGFDLPQDVEQGTEIELIIHEEMQMMWSGRKTPEEVAIALYDRVHKLMTTE